MRGDELNVHGGKKLTVPVMDTPTMASSRLKVILGTMEFGRRKLVDEKPCLELLDTFLARGHREVDTALMYTEGKSEKVIGCHPAAKNMSKMLIATKANPWGPKGLQRDRVLEQASISLGSLQVSCVDIFYLHAPDHNTPIEETLGACQQLYTEGKFKRLGLSNYAAWEVADIYHTCKKNGWILPTVYQGMYNAMTRNVEIELFPALKYFGISFYAYNPLAGGLLTNKYKLIDLTGGGEPEGRFFSHGKWSEVYRTRYWRESVFKGIEHVQEVLDQCYGVGTVCLASAAIRWMNHHSKMCPKQGDGIILGVSSMEQLEINLRSCEEGPLDERVVKAFDDAWEAEKGRCANYFR